MNTRAARSISSADRVRAITPSGVRSTASHRAHSQAKGALPALARAVLARKFQPACAKAATRTSPRAPAPIPSVCAPSGRALRPAGGVFVGDAEGRPAAARGHDVRVLHLEAG